MLYKRSKVKDLLLWSFVGFFLLFSGATLPSAYAETLAASATKNGRWTYALSSSINAGLAAIYTVDTDNRGETRIRVTGNGSTVTLASIQAGLGAPYANLLQDLGNGVWLLNANLFIDAGVTLNLGPQSGSNELRMRSEAQTHAARAPAAQVVTEPDGQQAMLAINYSSFVYLTTQNGFINLDGIKVYSWDPTVGAVDQDVSNGRAYLLAKYDAVLNIRDSDIGYLGSADGESYGVAWRDVNATAAPTVLLSRVTGQVLDNKFHNLYYGIYTFQASHMVFQGNEFYENIRYGFDPHDFTHDVLVENNRSHNNGAHGFIISRGCNNFIFRNNIAYDNFDTSANQAQGFMLDPGSPNSSDAQAPSHHNLLEDNEAYGNEGHGLRMLGSTQNQIRNNNFHNNQQGIVVDLKSSDNLIDNNTLNQNLLYGLFIRETADRTIATHNMINGNGSHGIYVRSSSNGISNNSATTNQGAGIALLPATGAPALADNQITTNTLTNNISNNVAGNLGHGLDLRGVTHTLVQANLIENNAEAGIYIANSSTQNSLVRNTIRFNQNYGILASGSQTLGNTWSENQIYNNGLAGIFLMSRANLNLAAPQQLNLTNNTLSGITNPNGKVEIFADNNTQGQFFLGRTTAAANGSFSFSLSGVPLATNLTALSIDVQGNASGFSTALNNQDGSTTTPTVMPTTTATPTTTPTSTMTPTLATTPTSTMTPTLATTPTLMPTSTATSTLVPAATSTMTSTPTPTPTLSVPPGSTPTATLTSTSIPPIATVMATPSAIISVGATSTVTPIASATVTPTTPATPSATLISEPTSLPGGTNATNHLFLPLIER